METKQPSHAARVRTRRRRYLEAHPQMFDDASSYELEAYETPRPGFFCAFPSDPLLYDRLVRQFQTAGQREAEGRRKGFSGKLEADLVRGEAKMDELSQQGPDSRYLRGEDGEARPIQFETEVEDVLESVVGEDEEAAPVPVTNKEEGLRRWRQVMRGRFMQGKDSQFDYSLVDENEEWDDWEAKRREEQDKYFDGEEPEWADGKREIIGETGVQDF